MTDTRRDRIYRTECVVLGRFDLGETNRIFTVFTPAFGKIRVIAKGIRRPQSRMAPHLEYFAQCKIMLARGRDLDVVTSAETIDNFEALRGDLEAFAHASHLAELLNRLTGDGQEHRAAYQLFVKSLRLLADGVDPALVARHFELNLLTLLGFRPELYRCVACGCDIQAESNSLSGVMGGMLCPRCRSADIRAPTLSVNAQKLLRVLDKQGLASASKLRVEPAVSGEVAQALSLYTRHYLERDLSSPRVLREIREGLPAADRYTV